jgi:hypothetical protein
MGSDRVRPLWLWQAPSRHRLLHRVVPGCLLYGTVEEVCTPLVTIIVFIMFLKVVFTGTLKCGCGALGSHGKSFGHCAVVYGRNVARAGI